jgi:D-alanyl-D-alanine carboxypeptidase/D-alanyl-D-alanine-endopeptidase (penicillin-binding protein 4)
MRAALKSDLSRRGFLTGLFAGVALPAAAGAPLVSLRPPLRGAKAASPSADALVSGAGISGEVVFAVADAGTGEMLEARGGATRAAPASVTKAITALYALDVLGSDHRFSTRILAPGGMKDGVVDGDLVLVGGCDPTLDTRALAELALRLKEAGLREVRGRFLVYEGPVVSLRSIDPEQPDQVGYSPAVAGIALNFNRVHFEWKRGSAGYAITMDARAGQYRPAVDIARMQIVDRKAPIYTYADRNERDEWTVAKGALGREGARWLPVRRPGLYAGDVFATLARSNGIVLKSPEITRYAPEGKTLALIKSDNLQDILQAMLKYSNNLIAEMVGLAATFRRVGRVGSLAASAAEMNTWAQDKLGMTAPAFADHSGLGSASRISPQDMVRGLCAAGRAEVLRPILKPLNLRDSNGKPVKDDTAKVEAKTGTLNFVSGLAGYITAPEGRELVFAIFSSDEVTRAKIPRAQRERPPGGRTWAVRARRLQQKLILRWASVYGV